MSNLVCECGKKMKSASGLSNHRRKCSVYLDSIKAKDAVEEKVTNEKATSDKITEEEKIAEVVLIGKGTTLVLSGTVWWQNAKYEWESATVEAVEVEVVSREPVENDIALICKSLVGQGIWSITESRVHAGEGAEIITLVSHKEESESKVDPKPDSGKREIDSEEETKYIEAANKYVSARDNKLDAEKLFKKVSKEHKKFIEEFVTKYGIETKPDLGDSRIDDYGFISHMVKTPGKLVVERDTEKIIQWCKDNGHEDCLTIGLNIKMWEALKTIENTVDSKFIRKVEKPVKQSDKFVLQIKENPDWEG